MVTRRDIRSVGVACVVALTALYLLLSFCKHGCVRTAERPPSTPWPFQDGHRALKTRHEVPGNSNSSREDVRDDHELDKRIEGPTYSQGRSWESYATAGRSYWNQMQSLHAAAGHQDPPGAGGNGVSRLEKMGWIAEVSRDDVEDKTRDRLEGLQEAFQSLDMPMSTPPLQYVKWEHRKPSKSGGVRYEPTNGYYSTYFEMNKGVIIIHGAHSPQQKAASSDITPVVPLQHWSQVVGATWLQTAKETSGADAKNLTFVLINGVSNEDTLATIKLALENRSQPEEPEVPMPKWADHWVVPMHQDSEVAMALLGSPNLACIAWLLIDYKAELGSKTVESITIWNDDGSVDTEDEWCDDLSLCQVNIMITIKDVHE